MKSDGLALHLWDEELGETMFIARQAALSTVTDCCELLRALTESLRMHTDAVADASSCFALAGCSRLRNSSVMATWTTGGERQRHTFGSQAIPMVWDFAEANPFC